MRANPGWRRVFRHEPNARHVDADVDAELRFHFEMTVRELMTNGLAPDEARREAERRFGNVERTRDALRRIDRGRVERARRIEALSSFAQDVRYAMRAVRLNPGFSLVVAGTLGLGIGATSTMFGIVDRLLLRGPNHIVAPQQLRRLYLTIHRPDGREATMAATGYVVYAGLRDRASSFDGVAAYSLNQSVVGSGVNAERRSIGAASWDLFPLLGVRPALGRAFGRDEDRAPNGADVVVLDHAYWQREYGSSPSVLGRAITIGGRPFRVIGVMPAGFSGAELQPVDMWMPLTAGQHPRDDWPTTWKAQWLDVVVRLKPSVTIARASQDAADVFRRIYDGPAGPLKTAALSLRPISYTARGTERPEAPVARWLLVVASIVLIIASANVANMMLARAIRRRREIAVRLALGVSMGRLARSLIAEALVLAVGGGLVGLVLAYGGGETVRRIFLPDVVWSSPPVDLRVLVAAMLLTATIGIALGVAPALQARRTDVNRALRTSSREGGVRRNRLRSGLLVLQAALSVALLAAAGLFIRSLDNVRAVNLGIQADRVLVATISWPAAAASNIPVPPGQKPAWKVAQALQWADMRDRIASLSEVEAASLTVGSPFGFSFGVGLKIPGRDSLPTVGAGTFVSAVGRDYFSTVGTRLVRGRVFTAGEGEKTERVVIVNETMARTLWPGETALGKCLVIGDRETRCSTVVGVVRDAHQYAIREEPSMQYYIPLGQENGFGGTVLMVRPKAGANFSAERLRRAVGAVAPSAQFIRVENMQDRINPQIRPWKLGATLFGLFGALAVLVAAIGLYSVITYLVAQRTHEFGVRAALGAGSRHMVQQILGEGVRVTVPGVAIGLLVALAAGRWIAPLLFNVSPRDPFVFAMVTITLLAVAVLASLAPAVRAARVDPVVALRED